MAVIEKLSSLHELEDVSKSSEILEAYEQVDLQYAHHLCRLHNRPGQSRNQSGKELNSDDNILLIGCL